MHKNPIIPDIILSLHCLSKQYQIMRKKLLVIFVLSLSLMSVLPSVSAQQTECIKVEQDGSMTVRATGVGRNRADAVEQAKKQALNDVLFRGGIKGTSSYYRRPVLTEVNAREKYRDYFDIFFMDGGAYHKYVSMEDKRSGSTFVKRSKVEVECVLTVRVLIPQLKARLQDDGVIKTEKN